MEATSDICVDSPLFKRLFAWLEQRFSPVAYTSLVAVFGLAGLSVGWATGGTRWGMISLPIIWLFFLHLRVFDEHKDFDKDRETHPKRVLSRGIVTLPLLARVGALAVLLQVGLAGLLGFPVLVVWVASFVFSIGMFVEFGVGRWLSKHIVLYAITHNPAMIGLALLLVLATGSSLQPVHGAFVAMSCFGMLGFEFGRKIHLPNEEHPGVPSYTSELGQPIARGMLLLVHVAMVVSLGVLLMGLGLPQFTSNAVCLGVVLPGLLTALGEQPAKRVELGASLVLFLGFLVIPVVCWSVQ